MLCLVTAVTFLQMLVGWEGVGQERTDDYSQAVCLHVRLSYAVRSLRECVAQPQLLCHLGDSDYLLKPCMSSCVPMSDP